jgi:hypothetical protein
MRWTPGASLPGAYRSAINGINRDLYGLIWRPAAAAIIESTSAIRQFPIRS